MAGHQEITFTTMSSDVRRGEASWRESRRLEGARFSLSGESLTSNESRQQQKPVRRMRHSLETPSGSVALRDHLVTATDDGCESSLVGFHRCALGQELFLVQHRAFDELGLLRVFGSFCVGNPLQSSAQ
jgi:hypothetical protein